jgi:hypothetical protein
MESSIKAPETRKEPVLRNKVLFHWIEYTELVT